MVAQIGAGTHPDLPDMLVHFTGRPRTGEPPPFASGTPEQRLVRILRSGELLASTTYGTTGPVACFSELSDAALQVLLTTGFTTRGPYLPWGILVYRERLLDAGAGPVWYMSNAELSATSDLPSAMKDRRVRFEPGHSDWLHEREWRLCWGVEEPTPARLPLADLLAGVVVGTQGWEAAPSVRTEAIRTTRGVGTKTFTRFAGITDRLPRFWWDDSTLREDGHFDVAAQMYAWDEARSDDAHEAARDFHFGSPGLPL